MKVKALLSGLSCSLFKVLEVKMSRLLLSSVLVALVAGLTLLACIPDPVEKEWLGEVGDEFQITDDAVVQHDPVFYNTENYSSIEEAQIAYHDGSSIYLYDIASKSTEPLYQAPSEYTITAMCTLTERGQDYYDLVFALEGAGENVVIRETNGVFTEMYSDTEAMIENIYVQTREFNDNEIFLLYLEREGNIYLYEDGILVDNFAGVEPNKHEYNGSMYYTSTYEGLSCIYTYYYSVGSGENGVHYLYYRHDYDVHYPFCTAYEFDIYFCFTADSDTDYDIWVRDITTNKISDAEGDEKELFGWLKYIVFTRTVNEKTDVFIIRGAR